MFDFFAPQLKEFEKIIGGMNESAELIRCNKEKIMLVQAQLNRLMVPRPKLAH